jgi:hypothetical protein
MLPHMNLRRVAVATVMCGLAAGFPTLPAMSAERSPETRTAVVAPAEPQVVNSCTHVARRPSRLSWCDSSDHVVRVTWRKWGYTESLGTGTFVNNTCRPSCAEGSYERFPVRIRLHRVRAVGANHRFTRATFNNPARGRAVYWMPLKPL